jgi:hypothetical protein
MLHFQSGPGATQAVAGSSANPKNDHAFVDLLAHVLMPLMHGAMSDQAKQAAAITRPMPQLPH